MKIRVLAIGKTDDKNLVKMVAEYEKRLKRYVRFELEILPDIKAVKNLSKEEQKGREAELFLKKLQPSETVFLLDEHGKELRSVEFAKFMQQKMNSGIKSLNLLIGGPYGFATILHERAQGKLSLSKMTFSHQMIRLFLIEQIYRAFTILKNEPYLHE